jgi:hypothetical protein
MTWSHQQLRAHLRGVPLPGNNRSWDALVPPEAVTANTRQAEFLAYKHWTLVYLMQYPDRRGEGNIVTSVTTAAWC